MATSKKIAEPARQVSKPADFFSSLSASAQRALAGKDIKTLKQLSYFSESEILQLHGIGKSSMPLLNKALQSKGLSLKKIISTTKPSETATVDAYMKKLKHPLKNVAAALREIILAADKSIGEEIAWNAPSFFYAGSMKPFNPKEYKRFIVVFNFLKKDCLRLIFLTGAKINDTSGLLQGDYADGRRLALFYSMDDVKSNGKILQQLVKKWLQQLEK
jgi:hypothetical protein